MPKKKKIFFIVPRISKYHPRRKQIDSRKISPIIGSYNAKVSASIELGTIARFQFTTGYSSYEAIIFFHISYTQKCSGNTPFHHSPPLTLSRIWKTRLISMDKRLIRSMERFPGRKYFEKDINVKKKKEGRPRISNTTLEPLKKFIGFGSNYRRVSNAALKFQSVFNYGKILVSRFTMAAVSPRKSDKERYLRGNTCVQRAWYFFVPRRRICFI